MAFDFIDYGDLDFGYTSAPSPWDDMLAGYDFSDLLKPQTFGGLNLADYAPDFGTDAIDYGDLDFGVTMAPATATETATPTIDFPTIDYGASDLGVTTPPLVPTTPEEFEATGQGGLYGDTGPAVTAPTPPPAAPESAVTRAIKGVTGAIARNRGQAVQAALGLGSLGMIGAGLAAQTPKLRVPERPTAPQEREAQQAMTAARQAISRPVAERGYAGEEAIRQKVNEQIMDVLEGRSDVASPTLVRRLDEQRRTLRDRLRLELGPGWETSTAGQNALQNFERMAAELLEQDRERKLQARNAMGLERSAFARTLEMDPFTAARAELAALADLGARDATLRFNVNAANQAQAAANRRALLTLGGQMGGLAAGPLLYRALLEALRQGRS